MLDAPGIVDWVRQAKPGDAAVYARGESVTRAVRALVGRLQAQGLIDATTRRDPLDKRLTQFIVQRRAKAYSVAHDRRRGRNYGRASAETVILRMIREAIRLKQPCPTNAEFAEAAGLSGRVSASYRLRKLRDAGKIILIDGGADARRVVTLVESGLSTVSQPL